MRAILLANVVTFMLAISANAQQQTDSNGANTNTLAVLSESIALSSATGGRSISGDQTQKIAEPIQTAPSTSPVSNQPAETAIESTSAPVQPTSSTGLEDKQSSLQSPAETQLSENSSSGNSFDASTASLEPTSEAVLPESTKPSTVSLDSMAPTSTANEGQKTKAQKPSLVPSSLVSPTKHTVIEVATVVVDGKLVLSSATVVLNENSATIAEDNGIFTSSVNDPENNAPFTSTVVVDGSTIIVTGGREIESSDSPPTATLMPLKMMMHMFLGQVLAMVALRIF